MIVELLTQLQYLQQRALLRVTGQQQELITQIQQELAPITDLNIVWFGEPSHQDLQVNQYTDQRIKQFRNYLGQETDIVVIDCYAGFSPDALGALAGTIRLGGLCILLTPENNDWLMYTDPEVSRISIHPYQPEQISHHFIQFIINQLDNSPSVINWSLNGKNSFDLPEAGSAEKTLFDAKWAPAANQQQAQLTSQIKQLPSTLNSALVVQADRGRGKSAALGIAAGQFAIENSGKTVLITAPNAQAIDTLWHHCSAAVGQQNILSAQTNELQLLNHSVIRFTAPDELCGCLPHADLLLVDEAAAIPVSLLKPVVQHYPSICLATTIHGYEGTGRGFEFKLKPLLQQTFSRLNIVELTKPVRWHEGDWLEADISKLLGLDSDLINLASHDFSRPQLQFQQWSQSQLVQTPGLLRQVFSLLVFAHYRTSPQDLRNLLDGPNVQVVGLCLGKQVVAAALIAIEGEIEPDLTEQIWQGRRRPRGHLVPQSLITHLGMKQAGNYKYARVVRIAVHPQSQNQGIGSHLINSLSSVFQDQGCDFVSTSFGVTKPLYNFWYTVDFELVRLGLKAEASSGEFSAMMLKPLNDQARAFADALQQRCQQTLLVEQELKLRQELQWLIPNTKLIIEFSEQDKLDIEAFINHHRMPDTCLLAVYRFLSLLVNNSASELLSAKFLAGRNNKVLCEQFNFSGEKQLVTVLKQQLKSLI